MVLWAYMEHVQALEVEAAAKIDTALRKKYGQHLVSISENADRRQQNKKRNSLRCKDSDGGRERSRTSDLYSVNLVHGAVHQCQLASLRVY
jgi:hypothetical protein